MIANGSTYGHDSGTIGDTAYTDLDYEQTELRCTTFYLKNGSAIKENFYGDFGLDFLLGGKVQWCYSKMFREWGWTLLYYKVKSYQQLKAQVVRLKPPRRCSGFVLPGRGSHWHRVSQLRRN